MNRILVIAPHPDDELLGCGATMAKQAHAGDEVYVAVMTNAHKGAPGLYPEAMIRQVRDEALQAHRQIGVAETFFFDFPAPCLELFPSYRISDAIRGLLEQLGATCLYLPFKGDAHKDHEVIFSAAMVAARPVRGCTVRELYAYETLSETEWGAPLAGNTFIPTRFTDVSAYMQQKLGAMACYRSQLNNAPHPRSAAVLESLARYRGATIGVAYAEAFMVIRSIG